MPVAQGSARLALLALLAAGCRRPPPVSAPAPSPLAEGPAPAPVPPAPADASLAPDAVPGPAPDAVSAPAPHPLAVRIRALAAGSEDLAAAIDPARGLTVVRFLEAPASGRGGETIDHRRVCPAGLPRETATLRDHLASALAQAEGPSGMQCTDDSCVAPGMEYQPEWRVIFENLQGVRRLVGLAQVSAAALSDSWRSRADAHVARALADARRVACRPTQR
jgi:hypothetical protein